jgi:adenosylcobinamide amidohydrolase
MKPAAAPSDAGAAIGVTRLERAIVVRFAAPQRVCSWAIVGGGIGRASAVAWVHVRDHELRPPVDARDLLRARLALAGAPDAVGLLTSRDLSGFVDVVRGDDTASARCMATVGLGNALRAGDSPGPSARIGTINLLCHVDVPLTDEAILEAMSIAAEARTAAILEAGVRSVRTGLPATGTGTDCIVVASPAIAAGARERYAGMHTHVGHLVGAAVLDAVAQAAADWKRERGYV